MTFMLLYEIMTVCNLNTTSLISSCIATDTDTDTDTDCFPLPLENKTNTSLNDKQIAHYDIAFHFF